MSTGSIDKNLSGSQNVPNAIQSSLAGSKKFVNEKAVSNVAFDYKKLLPSQQMDGGTKSSGNVLSNSSDTISNLDLKQGSSTFANQSIFNQTLTGDRLPEGKVGPAEHFSKMRDRDIEMLQNRLSRPQIQQNSSRMQKIQTILDFMQDNSMASYSDARNYYNMTIGRGPLVSHKAS